MEKNYKNLTPFKLCVLQNFPYIEEDFDALTNYGLMCKIVEYLNNVIDSQKEVISANEELQKMFTQLKNYVDNYFDRLDIQEEINNKLDEMAESGQLVEIISQYLNLTSVFVYDTIDTMKASEHINNGSLLMTYGYNTIGDGEGAMYYARQIRNDDVIDNHTIISLHNPLLIAEIIKSNKVKQYNTLTELKNTNDIYKGLSVRTLGRSVMGKGSALYKIIEKTTDTNEINIIELNNYDNLVAEYVVENNTIYIDSLGADNTDTEDNKEIIDKAISLIQTIGGSIIFGNGTYKTSGSHIVDSYGNLTIKGSGQNSTTIHFNGEDFMFWCQNEYNHLIVPTTFCDFTTTCTNESADVIGFKLSDRWGYVIKNITTYGFGSVVQFHNYHQWTEGALITDCVFRGCYFGITCTRDSENTHSSFFNHKIKNVACNLAKGNENSFIYLNLQKDSSKPINAYNWEVNATIWFEATGNNKAIIRVGDYNYLTGIVNIIEDGTYDNYEGNNYVGLLVDDNGLARIQGAMLCSQGAGIGNVLKFRQLVKQKTDWQRDEYRRPRAYWKGATVYNGVIIPNGTEPSVIYNSNKLPPYSTFKVSLNVEGNNGTRRADYLVTTTNSNFNVKVKNLTDENERYVTIRPANNGNPGGYQTNNGLVFEIYLAETVSSSDMKINYNIEML